MRVSNDDLCIAGRQFSVCTQSAYCILHTLSLHLFYVCHFCIMHQNSLSVYFTFIFMHFFSEVMYSSAINGWKSSTRTITIQQNANVPCDLCKKKSVIFEYFFRSVYRVILQVVIKHKKTSCYLRDHIIYPARRRDGFEPLKQKKLT